jgi:hypothetical protein
MHASRLQAALQGFRHGFNPLLWRELIVPEAKILRIRVLAA